MISRTERAGGPAALAIILVPLLGAPAALGTGERNQRG